MRKFLLLLTFVVLAKMNFAQSVFAPVGSYFSYSYSNYWAYGSQTLYYTGDTIINGLQCKKICKAGWTMPCTCPQSPTFYSNCDRFIFERNDSIYQYFQSNDSLKLLYTFNAQIGDSIVFISNYIQPAAKHKIVLDSIGTKFMCGSSWDVFYYSKYDTCGMQPTLVSIVKGFGPIDDYLFPQSACNYGEGNYYFSCLNTGICTYPSGTCANQPLSLQKLNETKLGIAYTPTGIRLQLSNAITGKIVISNILGTSVYVQQLLNSESVEYSTGQLAKGIYTFALNSNEGANLVGKFIVE